MSKLIWDFSTKEFVVIYDIYDRIEFFGRSKETMIYSYVARVLLSCGRRLQAMYYLYDRSY